MLLSFSVNSDILNSIHGNQSNVKKIAVNKLGAVVFR